METRVTLDAVGTLIGTDKCGTFSNAHDYLRHYEFFFSDFRQCQMNVIEIGVLGGRSLKTWKWYFSKAQIVGIDVKEHCLRSREARIDVVIGSQADTEFLRSICSKYPPTIVIDDGSHLAEHVILTFETMFPLLAAGGLYVVEDLSCHFGKDAPRWQTERTRDAPGYFMELALARAAKDGNGRSAGPTATIANVDSVTVFGGCVIIRKQHEERDAPAALRAADDYARENKLDLGSKMRLALFLVEHGGQAERAQRLMTEVLAKNANPEAVRVNALVEMAAGNAESAAAALAEADASGTPEGYLRRRLDDLRAQLNR